MTFEQAKEYINSLLADVTEGDAGYDLIKAIKAIADKLSEL